MTESKYKQEDDDVPGDELVPELSDPLLEEAETDPESEAASSEPADEGPPRVKTRGRVLASLAILLGLAAVAGVGYLYYLLVYLDPLQSLRTANEQSSEQQDGQVQTLQAEIDEMRAGQSSALATLRRDQAEALSANEAAVLESLQEALSAAPPSQREWKLAEAEYLLRIANHRVLMQQDTQGALVLLQAADQIIEELDDFALHQVRSRLADEIMALRQVPRDDLQGVYLAIEAVKAGLDELTFATPDYLQEQTQPEEDATVWEQLTEQLSQFIRVRTLGTDETVSPLLAPQEEHYLELNLRLALEQAQLAALKRHQAVYEHSLQNAKTWLARYMDPQDPATIALLDELETLLQAELAHPLPDVSGSLNELLAIGRGGA